MIRELKDQFHYPSGKVTAAESELFDLSKPDHYLVDKLKEIPGIRYVFAMGMIAEATDQMQNFADERKFAAWAGVAAGNNESAGKKRSKCRFGNPHLRRVLVQAAHAAKQKRKSCC